MGEQVLAVPAQLVRTYSRGRAFWSDGAAADNHTAASLAAAGQLVGRPECETDESRRQLIAYLLLRDADGRYFVYRRLPAGGEHRLADLYSIGVGGHLNAEGGPSGLTIETPALRPNLLGSGLLRELAEELIVPVAEPLGRLVLHGFLALDESAVDRVHLGVVARLDLAPGCADRVGIAETDKLVAAGWHAPAALRSLLADWAFEGWSRTLIECGLE